MTGEKDHTDFTEDAFDTGPADLRGANELVLDVEGYEGPLDVLLTLARAQKVDLEHISILALVEQYLEFINEARRLKLEIAADYLVMAAWLAYLKSRLLLPKQEDDGEESAEEMAARLQLRLQRLIAMREAGARLMSRNRLGRDVFLRGAPEGLKVTKRATYDVTYYELLKAYADFRVRHSATDLTIGARPVYTLEDALERLSVVIGTAVEWTQLADFLPKGFTEPQMRKSSVASMFVASLELARQGRGEIKQLETYGPLYVRSKEQQ